MGAVPEGRVLRIGGLIAGAEIPAATRPALRERGQAAPAGGMLKK